MPLDFKEIIQFGTTFALSIFVIYNFFILMKDKKKNGNYEFDKVSLTLEKLKLSERLSVLEVEFKDLRRSFDAHVQTIYQKIDKIDDKIDKLK